MKTLAFISILFFLPVLPAFSSDDPYILLKRAKESIDRGNYEDAVSNLDIFNKGSHLLRDYALYWRALSFSNMDRHENVFTDIGKIKAEYPASPILRKAIKLEAETASRIDSGRGIKSCRKYLTKYPHDNGVRLILADLLHDTGDSAGAFKEYKKIYISAKEFSDEALQKIDPAGLTVSDIYKRSNNLMKQYFFSKAEKELKEIIAETRGEIKRSIEENLAKSLFKQKKYNEAADHYNKLGDLYYETYSLYRASWSLYPETKEKFEEKLGLLIKKKDPKASFLRLKKALFLRRSGNVEAAITILEEIKSDPSIREDAMWNLGWAFYLDKNYKKALPIFNSLYKKYGDNRYLYWFARTSERLDQDASSLYERFTDPDNYYSLLALTKSGRHIPPIIQREMKNNKDSDKLKRLSILLRLDMKDAVAIESRHIMRQLSKRNHELILSACRLLNRAGLYNESIVLLKRIPPAKRDKTLLYPYAYKDLVKEVYDRFSVDPLLVLSIMREESRYDEDAYSPAGAAGLMQLIPPTARTFGGKTGIKIDNIFDIINVKNNILIGGFYMKELLGRFNSIPASLASYNAGEHKVEKWLASGNYTSDDEFIEDIPYYETRKYVKRVLKTYFQYKRIYDYDRDLSFYTLMNIQSGH